MENEITLTLTKVQAQFLLDVLSEDIEIGDDDALPTEDFNALLENLRVTVEAATGASPTED